MDLAKLVEAIEAATPDGDNLVMLEAAIYTATHAEDNAASWNGPYQHKGVASVVKKGHRGWSEVPRYLRSLDAAVSFVEAALPGWSGTVDFGSISLASVWHDQWSKSRPQFCADMPTPALALILAALRAMQATEKKRADDAVMALTEDFVSDILRGATEPLRALHTREGRG